MKEIMLLCDNWLNALHKTSQLRGCPDKSSASSKRSLRAGGQSAREIRGALKRTQFSCPRPSNLSSPPPHTHTWCVSDLLVVVTKCNYRLVCFWPISCCYRASAITDWCVSDLLLVVTERARLQIGVFLTYYLLLPSTITDFSDLGFLVTERKANTYQGNFLLLIKENKATHRRTRKYNTNLARHKSSQLAFLNRLFLSINLIITTTSEQ